MIRTIQGRRYLMRDKRSLPQLLALYQQFVEKFGYMDIHQWLVERGKVYLELPKQIRRAK